MLYLQIYCIKNKHFSNRNVMLYMIIVPHMQVHIDLLKHTHKSNNYTSRNKLQACCWGLAPGRQHDLPAHETIDAHHRTSAKNDITIHPWHNHFVSCALLTRKIKKVDWVQGKDKMYENGTECKPRIWHAVPIGCTQKRSLRECDVEHFESRFRDLQGKSNK